MYHLAVCRVPPPRLGCWNSRVENSPLALGCHEASPQTLQEPRGWIWKQGRVISWSSLAAPPETLMDLQTQGPNREVLTAQEQMDPRSPVCELTGYHGEEGKWQAWKDQITGEPAGAPTRTLQGPRQECGLIPTPVTPNQSYLESKDQSYPSHSAQRGF